MEETPQTNAPQPERVLIVEDDPATRTGLSELVQAWGFQSDEAPDGEEGYRKVTTFRPAIIVESEKAALAIADANGVELSTVYRWLKEARRRGLVAPAKGGPDELSRTRARGT